MIKETADALVSSGLADLGYNYINLDDCWQANARDASTGRINADTTRFPSGLKALGDYIHGKGLKFGIYSSAGFKTCQGYPASLGLEEIDAQAYADWQVDYLKYDNCYQDRGVPESRYGNMAKALQSTGRDIFYSLCEWGRENPATWASDIGAQSWRISGDIRDAWSSIRTRSEIGASLWRYSGPGRGWNDPDMLEIGNGQCTDDEYRTHFSLWAMLKAPLIVGNDIRIMSTNSSIYSILSNKEVIAVNQDTLGLQGRIVWSDLSSSILPSKGYGDRLIAAKCSSGTKGAYEDAKIDQRWSVQADGTIKSASTGQCLVEMDTVVFHDISSDSQHFDFTRPVRAVTTGDCATATQWTTQQYAGAGIVSRSSGLCLEVEKMEYLPITQGKRIQTAPCQNIKDQVVDVREHQSWTTPNGELRNLYQRQCLTVDRDAFPGLQSEVWSAPLADGSLAVLIVNKGPIESKLEISTAMLGLTKGIYSMRDLWQHKDLTEKLTADHSVPFLVKSHASVMLKVFKA